MLPAMPKGASPSSPVSHGIFSILSDKKVVKKGRADILQRHLIGLVASTVMATAAAQVTPIDFQVIHLSPFTISQKDGSEEGPELVCSTDDSVTCGHVDWVDTK